MKLFNYPCVYDDAPYREYKGHASYVTCVRWGADDRLLFSAGGGDRCVFQWRAVGVAKEDALKGAAAAAPARDSEAPPHPLSGLRPRRKEAPWCDVAQCTFCNRRPLPPPPPPLWGPLDEAGKTWGSISYNARSGACSCRNCRLRLAQEMRAFDRQGTGALSPSELVLALRAFGEPPLPKEKLAAMLAASTLLPPAPKAAAAARDGDGDAAEEEEPRYLMDPLIGFWMADIAARQEKFKSMEPEEDES